MNPNKRTNWELVDLRSATKQCSNSAAAKIKRRLLRTLKKRAHRDEMRIARSDA